MTTPFRRNSFSLSLRAFLIPDANDTRRRFSSSSCSLYCFVLSPGLFYENEEISSPPPCGFLIGIYLFYENWSTETFSKQDSNRWVLCYTYIPSVASNFEVDDYRKKSSLTAGVSRWQGEASRLHAVLGSVMLGF